MKTKNALRLAIRAYNLRKVLHNSHDTSDDVRKMYRKLDDIVVELHSYGERKHKKLDKRLQKLESVISPVKAMLDEIENQGPAKVNTEAFMRP